MPKQFTKQPLQPGDEIRVIAPSDSKKPERRDNYLRAQARLEAVGYVVTYGQHLDSVFHLDTAPAKKRAADFNAAYADPKVKAIIAIHGGFAANELLPFIDWDLVRKNPKPLVGYSDITVLLNAIYAKTGTVNYLGPNFGTLGHETTWHYSFDNLLSALTQTGPRTLAKSDSWLDQQTGISQTTPNWETVQPGSGSGVLLGGNISTFYLVQGTEYQPKCNEDFILALEDDELLGEYTLHGFSRSLESILQLPNVRKNLRGILIGRFELGSAIDDAELDRVIRSKSLGDIPVIKNVDFGHTVPMLTLPIGGNVSISAQRTAGITIL